MKSNVAQYLRTQLAQCGRSQTDIARELGYERPNILSMMKREEDPTKVPLDKVCVLADALGVDRLFLLRLVMSEYLPAVWQQIEGVVAEGSLLTKAEKGLIALKREIFQERELDLSDPRAADLVRTTLRNVEASQALTDDEAVSRYFDSPTNARAL